MTIDISSVLGNPRPYVEYDWEYWAYYYKVQASCAWSSPELRPQNDTKKNQDNP